MGDWTTELDPTQFIFSVRFDQGHRYLDKCGEAIIRLEDSLQEGWLPGQTNPDGANLFHFALGMQATFNAYWLTVTQGDFLAFEPFLDQSCKIYDVLRGTFGIKRILTPALRVVFQLGFADVEHAEQFLVDLKLCDPDAALLEEIGGGDRSQNFTVCTESEVHWQTGLASERKRFEAKVIKQERQPFFDERIMMRLAQVPERYHDQLARLRALRRQHPRLVEVAVQFDLEDSFETEFSSTTFDLPAFLSQAYAWTRKNKDFLLARMKKPCQDK
jgi:hypothetical protein